MILFCIPFAGGNSVFFNDLKKEIEISTEYEVILYDYPGHGKRIEEPLVDNFQSLFMDVRRAFIETVNISDDVAILGYSMGALVAYELSCAILNSYKIKHLFVAAMEPPAYIQQKHQEFKAETDDNIQQLLNRYGSDNSINKIADQRFKSIFLRPLLVDFSILAQYVHEFKIMLDFKITVINSIDDIDSNIAKKWNDYSKDGFSIYEFHGNHFFLREHIGEIASIIQKELKETGGKHGI